MRLARFMALCGVASRRKCEEIIFAGRVTVNGVVVDTPGVRVGGDDLVSLDGGAPLVLGERVYLALNKPVGYMCSASDPYAEKTVFDLVDIPGVRLFTVGRLDVESEGLVLVTNDGEWADKIAHPRYGVLKIYNVETSKKLADSELEELRKGIRDEGEFLKPVALTREKGRWLKFVMSEGKKREIRRLVASTGARVSRLRRISVGDVKLGELETGKWRWLTEEERTLATFSTLPEHDIGNSQCGRSGGENAPKH